LDDVNEGSRVVISNGFTIINRFDKGVVNDGPAIPTGRGIFSRYDPKFSEGLGG
jgi:hypothetical protein